MLHGNKWIGHTRSEQLALALKQSAYLGVQGGRLGISAEWVARLDAAIAPAQTALPPVLDKDIVNHTEVEICNAAFAVMLELMRDIKDRFAKTPPFTVEDRVSMGYPIPDESHTRQSEPVGTVRLRVENPDRHQVVLVADRDPGSLPDGSGVEATKEYRYTVVKSGDSPLAAGVGPEDLHFSLQRRPKRVVLNLPEDSSGGTLYVSARWLNSSGYSGPWCGISKTVIT
ncbi:hypothetical protein FACS189491_03680 [Spirochaetia bacterium]|nr:hypothetical protein FACS189491_03680 [Spirochaetia bacterium]